MNIIATAILAGSFAALPISAADLKPINPFDGVSVSAGGIGLDFDADGIEAKPVDHTDFQIQVRLKSGSPIRVRL